MVRPDRDAARRSISVFDRHFFNGTKKFTYIGHGSLGGKAQGLAYMKDVIESNLRPRFIPDIDISIPTLTVITTNYFDIFMRYNNLYEIAYSDARDDIIAHAFQRADLPVELLGDLWALINQVHTPLAIRSSSMLEDAMFEPFASVYTTKMIPNNQASAETRFKKLVEAIKFVYASAFFKDAKNYMKMTKYETEDEKMAVIIQEVVGKRYGDRFYPHISGVIRSYNFYPTGNAKPEEGVVDLALGLGKTVVDEGIAWSYSPAHPKSDPPYNSIQDLLKQTQTEFWAVNMGEPPAYDPIKETEYMMKCNLKEAEYDNTLRFIASTYLPQEEKIVIGVGEKGPRVINFAPILKVKQLPLNDLIIDLVDICEDVLGTRVEIEFAMTLDKQRCKPAYFGFLQVRPMVVSHEEVEVTPDDMKSEKVLLASDTVVGNGIIDHITDIVYVKPENFDTRYTVKMAEELEKINHKQVAEDRPYILIGFGRWGTSDPQAGIPVKFGQVSGARVMVEATLPELNYTLSQGSHFFHNVTSFKILYFSVYHYSEYRIKWEWLNSQRVVEETEFIRHIETEAPLTIKVDGRYGRGVILHE